MNESWQRKRLFEALARALLADTRPLLLAFDDLQWCDRETLEWLHFLLRYEPQARLLIAGTVRPEEVSAEEAGADHPLAALLLELRSNGQVTELELGPLSLAETAALAAQVKGQELNGARAQRLFGETEGNPLFVVETMQMELAQTAQGVGAATAEGAHAPPKVQPQRVQAVIQRRLAHLSPPARELASLAAVIGRFFTFALLASVLAQGVFTHAGAWDEDALARGLDELWQRRIIREQGLAAYDFSHDRIREVAYNTLSPSLRRLWHRRVARALETLHAGDLDAVSGQIAAHYERAAQIEEAIPYFQRAATVAQHAFAHADAIELFRKALWLLAQLPATPDHARQELAMRLALAMSLNSLKGSTTPEVQENYQRADELSKTVGDDYQKLVAHCGRYLGVLSSANLPRARAMAEECLAMVQKLDNPRWLAETQGMFGVLTGQMGEWATSRAYFEQALANPAFQSFEGLSLFQEQHHQLTARRQLAMAIWHLGYPDQAMARAEEAVALAQPLGNPLTFVQAANYVAWLHQRRREVALTQHHAAEVADLSRRYGLTLSVSHSLILSGWALAQQGQPRQGIEQIRASLALRPRHGLHWPRYLAMLAEAHLLAGEPEAGLQAVEEGLAIFATTGDGAATPELHHLKGDLLLLRGGDLDEAQACYRQALAVARSTSAKSLELRAALRLARLWQRQGHVQAAHELLAPLYAWFTEGFDTADLQEARALLAELG
jgi:tetratricopeptide (TPR) repeat protein